MRPPDAAPAKGGGCGPASAAGCAACAAGAAPVFRRVLPLGDSLPLSVFAKYGDDCHMPQGTAAYEKRGVATDVPLWNSENCIQCNQCAFVCPHACIRPFLCTEEEVAKAPKGAQFLEATGFKGYKYTLQVSTLDCTGCGVCLTVCPGKKVKDESGAMVQRPALTSHSMAESNKNKEARTNPIIAMV